MLVHTTQNLAKLLFRKPLPNSPETYDPKDSWRANYCAKGDERFIVFMHDETHYAIAINNPRKIATENLGGAFFKALSDTMLADSINPQVIEKYISECGEPEFVRNQGQKEIGCLNNLTKNVGWLKTRFVGDTALSVAASHEISTWTPQGFECPASKFYGTLEKYGLPVYKGSIFELDIKLVLDGADAIRRVRVPSSITFEQLHRVIQKAYNWRNSNLYKFCLHTRWSDSTSIRLTAAKSDTAARESLTFYAPLSEYLPTYRKILYTYGPNWLHYIKLVDTFDSSGLLFPTLESGKGDAPADEMSKPEEFAHFLKAIADPSHPDHAAQKELASRALWESFDLNSKAGDVSASLCL
jgi:hypothetical protein